MAEFGSAEQFIQGLKKSKNTYVECPHCRFVFSLFAANIMYGKNPPKDLLAKSQKQLTKTLDDYAKLMQRWLDNIEKFKTEKYNINYEWRNKLNLKYQEFLR